MPTEQDSKPAIEAGDARSVSRANRVWIPLAVILVTVGVFSAAIILMAGTLSGRLRESILQEDSMVLQAATAAAQAPGAAQESEQDRLEMLFKASNIRDEEMFGLRVFDQNGRHIIGRPQDLMPLDLSEEQMTRIWAGERDSKFDPVFDVSSEYLPGSAIRAANVKAPVLIVTVPIRADSGKVIGAAEFLLSGERVFTQLKKVDREVRQSALWFCAVGGAVISIALTWGFTRFTRMNSLLAERTANLLRANHELTMAAKTSAVGAVAAHLIHGLKNPLFGLQAFVSIKSEDEGGIEWKAAVESAKRMQSMIADVVRIMREESGQAAYEITIDELLGVLQKKVGSIARESSVELVTQTTADGALPNREANLIILALTNLIQNAVQASKPETKVTLEISENQDSVVFEVSDQAGGLPAAMVQNMFLPCQSSKPGGTGLGLAITKQLANHMGGQLELVSTGKEGTRFRLSIPRQLFLGAQSNAKLQTANVVA